MISAALISGCVAVQQSELSDSSRQASAVVTTGLTSFQPPQIRIRRGETVIWRNTSLVRHTVTADPARAGSRSHVRFPPGAERFHSDLPPGGVYRHTFDVAGHYRYFCIPHEQQGMIGEVFVEE